MRQIAVLLMMLLVPLEGALAQLGRVVQRTPANTLLDSYRLYEPKGKPVGLLVLLPGGAATNDDFGPHGSTPSTLPGRLATVPMVTLVPGSGPGSWLNDRWLEQLDLVVAETLKTHDLPYDRVVVGGFSGGGTDAVRYAEYCAAGRSAAGVKVRGVFAADAPLDLARLWRGETLAIARGAHAGYVAEAKMVLGQLAEMLGGPPEEHGARYLEVSPVSAFAKGAGKRPCCATSRSACIPNRTWIGGWQTGRWTTTA